MLYSKIEVEQIINQIKASLCGIFKWAAKLQPIMGDL